jgi:hypothetical protein
VLARIRDLGMDLVGSTCLAPELTVQTSATCGPDMDQSSARTAIQAGSEACGQPPPGPWGQAQRDTEHIRPTAEHQVTVVLLCELVSLD